MSNTIKTVFNIVPKDEYKDNVAEVLSKVAELDADSIIVFAWVKGKIFYKDSGSKNRLELMGALQEAMMNIWQNADQ